MEELQTALIVTLDRMQTVHIVKLGAYFSDIASIVDQNFVFILRCRRKNVALLAVLWWTKTKTKRRGEGSPWPRQDHGPSSV